MDLKHAQELDELLNEAKSGKTVSIFKGSPSDNIRNMRLYQYMQTKYGYMDNPDNNGFRINGAGIIALEVNNGKPFEEMYNKEEREKEQLKIDKEMLIRDKWQNKLINALAPTIAAIAGGLFTYYFLRK